jgi:ATP-dependent helicase HrpB
LIHKPHSAEALEDRVAAAFEELLRQGIDGDVLVFLPGAAEIRRCGRTCEGAARRGGVDITPLHGDLPAAEQDRAVLPGVRPKLILSTNVAESSITIEGVTAVIDSGLARVVRHLPWTGFPVLRVERVSQASATQRAGRAGRLRPGRVIRLYPAEDYHRRPAHDMPEILRRELSQTILDLLVLNAGDLEWLDAPPAGSVDSARELLLRLGAVDEQGGLTRLGRRMAELPLHPRLARMVLEEPCDEVIGIAAMLSAGERLSAGHPYGSSDLLAMLAQDWSPRTSMVAQQIRRYVKSRKPASDDDVLQAALCAFPDRVARRRTGNDLLLSTGSAAQLAVETTVQGQEFLIAADVEERPERGQPLVRVASGIRPDWLLDRFPNRITERSRVEWDRQRERVDGIEEILYDQLVIDETRGRAVDPERAASLLAEKALETGITRFVDGDALEHWQARLRFASKHSSLPQQLDVRAALEQLCLGLRSFSELRDVAPRIFAVLEQMLPERGRALLNELAPERIRLPNGRSARVHYADGQPPWIASRLQDFFGMRETPRVANGRESVVVHLLAPNQRPVQMTSDLAGFWERLYPQVRRELSRRYPKHAWPEKPD